MDLLFEKFNVFKLKESSLQTFQDCYQDKIFDSDTSILEIYNYIRLENVSYYLHVGIIRDKAKDYIQNKLLQINSVNTCYNILNDIINKLSRVRLLFDYIRNRKQEDLFFKFIEDFYTIAIKNIHVFIEHIFNHLINPKTPNYIYENAYKSFNIFINYLNYSFDSPTFKNNTNLHYDQALEQYKMLYNKYTTDILFYFTSTMKLYFTSHVRSGNTSLLEQSSLSEVKECKAFLSNKTLESGNHDAFSNLIADFNLMKKCIGYEEKMTSYLKNKKYIVENQFGCLPVLDIIQNVNIYNTSDIYYDIIRNQLENNPNPNLINYLKRSIQDIESNIAVTKEKYKSEILFIEISKIFRIYSKMRLNWYMNNEVTNSIKESINNILDLDDVLLNYIITSLIIFIKKLDSNTFTVLKDLSTNICHNIAFSNKESKFLDIFNQNLQTNSLKNKITPEFYQYINNIVDFFDPIESNYIKIKKFLDEIKINIDYNKEVSKINVTCKKNSDLVDFSFDPKNLDVVLINKEIWKIKNSNHKFKIPDEISVYFKIYEQFYNLKHNFRSIEWSMDNSFIDIEINKFTISGTILPISILFLISKESLDFNKLLELLETSNNELIDSNIKLLESNNIITKNNLNNYVISEITSDINLNKLTITKNKTVATNIVDFDINNSTDCFIIKILKPLNTSGLSLDGICIAFEEMNKYFKVTKDFMQTRVDGLIKKSYIDFRNGEYYYDV